MSARKGDPGALQNDPWFRTLIILLVIIAATYLAGFAWSLAVLFADIILLLVLAWVLAFALEPITALFQRNARLKRGIAVAIVYSGLLIVLSLAILLIVPVVAIQISQIGANLPLYAASAEQWLTGVEAWLLDRGVLIDTASLLDYNEVVRRVEDLGPPVVNQALGLATGVASVLFSMVLVLIFSFYVMLDGDRITRAALQATPVAWRPDAEYLLYSIHRAFGGYVRGQLIQALVYGTGTAVIMLAADLSYVAVAAIFAAVIVMVPLVGPMLALIPPVVISAFGHPDRVWWVLLLLLLLQQVVLNVLAPRVMGHTVGMHPLLVLLSLLIGLKLAGAWGAIFAVPIVGVIVAMVTFYRMTVEERARHVRSQAGNSPGRIERADSAPRKPKQPGVFGPG